VHLLSKLHRRSVDLGAPQEPAKCDIADGEIDGIEAERPPELVQVERADKSDNEKDVHGEISNQFWQLCGAPASKLMTTQ
jgi:hypothetical protein